MLGKSSAGEGSPQPLTFGTFGVGHSRRLLRPLAIFPLRSLQLPTQKSSAGEGSWRLRLPLRLRSATREDCCARSQSFHFALFNSLHRRVVPGKGVGAFASHYGSGRPLAKIAAPARNLSTSLSSTPYTEE